MHADELKRIIKAQGGTGVVSRRMGVKQARLCNWIGRKSVPPHRIIPLCRALFWAVTPHQLRPDLYPHPTDGMMAADGGMDTAGKIPVGEGCSEWPA